MAQINLNLERCKGCGLCIGACPIENLRISGSLNRHGAEFAEIIDPNRCTGCALCCRICPDMAIEIAENSKIPSAETVH